MVRIRRIGILRTATVLAILYAITALIFFVIFALLVLVAGLPTSTLPGAGLGGSTAGISIIIGGLILTAVYGLLGWIFTALFCFLYNIVADVTGGVEFELQSAVPPQPAPTWTPPPAAPGSAPPSQPTPPAAPTSQG